MNQYILGKGEREIVKWNLISDFSRVSVRLKCILLEV